MTGTQLRAARQAAGLSQEALGQRVGASQATVARWESGRLTPSEETSRQLDVLFAGAPVSLRPAPRRERSEDVLSRVEIEAFFDRARRAVAEANDLMAFLTGTREFLGSATAAPPRKLPGRQRAAPGERTTSTVEAPATAPSADESAAEMVAPGTPPGPPAPVPVTRLPPRRRRERNERPTSESVQTEAATPRPAPVPPRLRKRATTAAAELPAPAPPTRESAPSPVAAAGAVGRPQTGVDLREAVAAFLAGTPRKRSD